MEQLVFYEQAQVPGPASPELEPVRSRVIEEVVMVAREHLEAPIFFGRVVQVNQQGHKVVVRVWEVGKVMKPYGKQDRMTASRIYDILSNTICTPHVIVLRGGKG